MSGVSASSAHTGIVPFVFSLGSRKWNEMSGTSEPHEMSIFYIFGRLDEAYISLFISPSKSHFFGEGIEIGATSACHNLDCSFFLTLEGFSIV